VSAGVVPGARTAHVTVTAPAPPLWQAVQPGENTRPLEDASADGASMQATTPTTPKRMVVRVTEGALLRTTVYSTSRSVPLVTW
jgi:hypothetical protein